MVLDFTSLPYLERMPEVSIIVPVYNAEPFLRKCMDSLVSQTLKEIEIICVDDGSLDQSGKILDEYANRDARVRVFHQQNQGPSSARNNGMKEAHAPYIMFCDGDDWCAPSMCEEMLKAIHGGAEMAICGLEKVSIEGSPLKNTVKGSLIPSEEGEVEVSDTLRFCLSRDSYPVSKIFKRDIISQNQIEFPMGLRWEDMFFFSIYLPFAHHVHLVAKSLYYYRQHSQSFLNRLQKTHDLYFNEQVKIAFLIWEYYRDHGLLQQHMLFVSAYVVRLFSFSLMLTSGNAQIEQLEQMIFPFIRKELLHQSGLHPLTRIRLKCILQHQWVGTRYKWWEILRIKIRDRCHLDQCKITTTYYLFGAPFWRRVRTYKAPDSLTQS